jgi:hypothetical protein
LGAVGAAFLEAKAACSADDAWVVPALPLHEAVRRSCRRLGWDSTVYLPSHTLTHSHTPSHAPMPLPGAFLLPPRPGPHRVSHGAGAGHLLLALCRHGWRTESNRHGPRQQVSPAVAGSPHPITTAPPLTAAHRTHRPLTTMQAPVSSARSASARLSCASGASRRGTRAARRALPPSPPSSTWASRARACWGTCMRTRWAQHDQTRRPGGGRPGHRRP